MGGSWHGDGGWGMHEGLAGGGKASSVFLVLGVSADAAVPTGDGKVMGTEAGARESPQPDASSAEPRAPAKPRGLRARSRAMCPPGAGPALAGGAGKAVLMDASYRWGT